MKNTELQSISLHCLQLSGTVSSMDQTAVQAVLIRPSGAHDASFGPVQDVESHSRLGHREDQRLRNL